MNVFEITIEERNGENLFRCGDVLFNRLRAEWVGDGSKVEIFDGKGELHMTAETNSTVDHGEEFIVFGRPADKEHHRLDVPPTTLWMFEDFNLGDKITIMSEEVDDSIFLKNVETAWRWDEAGKSGKIEEWFNLLSGGRGPERERVRQEYQEAIHGKVECEILEDGCRIFRFGA